MTTKHDTNSKEIAVEVMKAMAGIIEKVDPEASTSDVCSGLLMAAATTMFDINDLPDRNPVIDMVGRAAVAGGHNEVGLLIGSIISAFHMLHQQETNEAKAKAAVYN